MTATITSVVILTSTQMSFSSRQVGLSRVLYIRLKSLYTSRQYTREFASISVALCTDLSTVPMAFPSFVPLLAYYASFKCLTILYITNHSSIRHQKLPKGPRKKSEETYRCECSRI